MNENPQIAIDFRWLDHLSLGNGQFRYATELIRGLAELRQDMRFVVLGSRPEPVSEIASVFGDRWRYQAMPRLSGTGSVYREQWQYFRLLRKMDVNVLHALHTFVPMYPPVPVIETVYDMMLELFPEYSEIVRSREYRLHKWAFRRFATRAIAISKTTASDLQRLWQYPAERIDVVYLGANLPEGVSSGVRGAVPMILAPYNLEARKNLSRLLQASAKLKERGLKFRLVLFGRAAVNEERERGFREEVARFGLNGTTELTGWVSDEERARLYGESSAFVFPSLYEGFGLPLVEAMNAGATVVAHNASAMAELVGDAGILVDMDDVNAIAEGIETALADSASGARARARAQEFSRERMAKETLAVYEKVVGGSR